MMISITSINMMLLNNKNKKAKIILYQQLFFWKS